jgi:hypothetical protein
MKHDVVRPQRHRFNLATFMQEITVFQLEKYIIIGWLASNRTADKVAPRHEALTQGRQAHGAIVIAPDAIDRRAAARQNDSEGIACGFPILKTARGYSVDSRDNLSADSASPSISSSRNDSIADGNGATSIRRNP